MKSGWTLQKISDISRVNGNVYSTKENWPFVDYLDTGNITENVIDSIQRIDLKTGKLPARARRKVTYNSIIYSTVRPNQRHFGIMKDVSDYLLVSTGFAVIDVNTPLADADFLYFYLSQPNIVERLHSIAEQSVSAYPSIKASDIENLEIRLPPIHVQRNISAILRSLDDKIALNTRINDNLQQQAKAIFKEWFIENSESDNWDLGVFSELITGTISGDWGKDAPHGNNSEMVYCIRGADIPDVLSGNKGKMPIRYILPKNYAAKRLVDGDIVVEISGGSPTQSTGRVAVISTFLLNRYQKGMVCTNFCKAIKPLPGYSMFVYHYWQYLYDANVFFSYENGTTGIKNFDISGFMEMESIRMPPPELVLRFDSFCKSLLGEIYSNGLENEYLASVRDTLLPRLMSGELDVSNIEL